MAFEKDANKIGKCCFCRVPWSPVKLANQGYLSRDHKPGCPFKELGDAAEQCIVVRNDEQPDRETAEKILAEKIDALFSAMTEEIVPECPFPVCRYSSQMGHRLELSIERRSA
jgi:hypothetical protein